mmetsp:Transcript_26522/g.56842  ORF Transcript_26522/g.56842 Transcript_26522/m.56842 type:complete len:112 (-) Transcript_26522:227-562(-)
MVGKDEETTASLPSSLPLAKCADKSGDDGAGTRGSLLLLAAEEDRPANLDRNACDPGCRCCWNADADRARVAESNRKSVGSLILTVCILCDVLVLGIFVLVLVASVGGVVC